MSIKEKPIAVLGAGSWGTALALLLARNGNTVRLWGNDPELQRTMLIQKENPRYLPGFAFPEKLVVVDTLEAALQAVQDVLIAVPSYAFRTVINSMVPFIKAPRIAWGTKGLDPSTQTVLHPVVYEVFSEQTPVAVLSGPSFAKEVAEEKPTALSLSGNYQDFVDDLTIRLQNPYFRVYQNTDMLGLELCGTLKNILAIAVGIAAGLEFGANTRAALMTRGLVEMGRLCDAMGADKNTLLSLAGVGDLVLTCTDDQSRNLRFGKAIGAGNDIKTAEKMVGQAVEGLHNVQQVHALAKQYRVEMPIAHQVYRILYQSIHPKEAVVELLARSPKAE